MVGLYCQMSFIFLLLHMQRKPKMHLSHSMALQLMIDSIYLFPYEAKIWHMIFFSSLFLSVYRGSHVRSCSGYFQKLLGSTSFCWCVPNHAPPCSLFNTLKKCCSRNQAAILRGFIPSGKHLELTKLLLWNFQSKHLKCIEMHQNAFKKRWPINVRIGVEVPFLLQCVRLV